MRPDAADIVTESPLHSDVDPESVNAVSGNEDADTTVGEDTALSGLSYTVTV